MITKARDPKIRERIRLKLFMNPDSTHYSIAKELGITPQALSYHVKMLGIGRQKREGRPPGDTCCVCQRRRVREAYSYLVCNSPGCVNLLMEVLNCQPEDYELKQRLIRYSLRTGSRIPETAVICTRSKTDWLYRSLREHLHHHLYSKGKKAHPPTAFAKFERTI